MATQFQMTDVQIAKSIMDFCAQEQSQMSVNRLVEIVKEHPMRTVMTETL